MGDAEPILVIHMESEQLPDIGKTDFHHIEQVLTDGDVFAVPQRDHITDIVLLPETGHDALETAPVRPVSYQYDIPWMGFRYRYPGEILHQSIG